MPVIKLDYTNTKINDTYVAESAPTTNYGSNTLVYAGPATSGGPQLNGLMKFDLGLIPNNAIINSAKLTVYQASSAVTTVNIHAVLTDWIDSVVTWNTRPTVEEVASKTFTALASGGSLDIDIKNLVQKWVNGQTNYGFCIQTPNTPAFNIDSVEYTTVGQRPTLTIDYTIPTTDKKQVEFVERATSFRGESDNIVTCPIPASRLPKDMLVAYVYSKATGVKLVVPEGWSVLNETELINSNIGMTVFYKLSDGTETTFTTTTVSGNTSSYVSMTVYRNVRSIENTTAAKYNATSNISPNMPPPFNAKDFVVVFNAVEYSAGVVFETPLNFMEETKLGKPGMSISVFHRYMHIDGSLTASDLVFKTNINAPAGSKLIKLVPITNLVPTIDGKDEFLGALSSPLIKPYTVTDTENNTVTITEKLNGNTIRQYTGTGAQTLNLTPQWASLPVGKHTVTVEANDDYNNPPHTPTVRTWTFLKILPDTATLTESVTGLHQVVPFLQSQKAILASALRGKGVTVNDTDRLEDMAKALSSIVYSIAKTGTSISSSGNYTFKKYDATAIGEKYIVLNTDVIGFQPKYILVWRTNLSSTIFTWSDSNFYEVGSNYANIQSINGMYRKEVVGKDIYIPVDGATTAFSWLAYS